MTKDFIDTKERIEDIEINKKESPSLIHDFLMSAFIVALVILSIYVVTNN